MGTSQTPCLQHECSGTVTYKNIRIHVLICTRMKHNEMHLLTTMSLHSLIRGCTTIFYDFMIFLIEDIQETTFWESYRAQNKAFQEDNFLKIILIPLRKDL